MSLRNTVTLSCLLAVIFVSGPGCRSGGMALDGRPVSEKAAAVRLVGPFPAKDAARHQAWIQAALDEKAEASRTIRIAPGEYMLADAAGLRVPSHTTLLMDGARFVLAETIQADGQAFLLENASDVMMQGGEVVGRRDVWPDSVNVAGVRATGSGRGLHISGLTCRDLSSNAVGVFGASKEAPYCDVTLAHVVGINCCNVYVDYLQANKGPAQGSNREDQGTVAFYFVDGWMVDACRFEGARSDGTHFCHSRNGSFTNSRVTGSQMGGYFLEDCENVVANGNLFRENGSRGVTIERDSRFCTLTGNVITLSGREGLWMPDVEGIVVSSNVFRENGQKDDGEKDCEIRLDDTKEFATVTRNVRVTDNLFITGDKQTAAVYTGAGVGEVVVESNTFSGPAPQRCSPQP